MNAQTIRVNAWVYASGFVTVVARVEYGLADVVILLWASCLAGLLCSPAKYAGVVWLVTSSPTFLWYAWLTLRNRRLARQLAKSLREALSGEGGKTPEEILEVLRQQGAAWTIKEWSAPVC